MDDPFELTLTLHGLDSFNEDVDAIVFARKLTAFLKGIRHCDRAVNGKVRHKLLLSQLKKNTATASVREQVYIQGIPPASAMATYSRAVDAIYHQKAEARDLPISLLHDIVSLNKGVGHSFAFGEIKSNYGQMIRIDPYFAEVAESLVLKIAKSGSATEVAERRYVGKVYGSFDGELKAVDLRDDIKQGKLILTVGKREIDCILNDLSKEELQAALDTRVIAYGLAQYDTSSLLPVHVNIMRAQPVITRTQADLSRWRGAFKIQESLAEDWN